MSTSARHRKPAPTTVTASPSTAGDEDTIPIPIPIPRASASTSEAKKELEAAVSDQAAKTSSGFSVLDVLRVLGGLALLSAGLSYLSTSGESMTWGYNGKWTRMREWRNVFVSLGLPQPDKSACTC